VRDCWNLAALIRSVSFKMGSLEVEGGSAWAALQAGLCDFLWEMVEPVYSES
jgi:hypothetical protein